MIFESFEIFAGPLGYLALFIGTLLEGELIVVFGGYLAQQGILNIWGVVVASFLGSLIADQVLFYIGYTRGEKVLKRFPQRYVKKIQRIVIRFETPYILLFRFIYGTRTISPLILGSSKIKRSKFIILNLIAGAIWALSFSFGGYFVGKAVGTVIQKIQIQLGILLLCVISIVLITKLIFHYKTKNAHKK